MATQIQLFQFATKASPVPADIVYLGDSANSFDEVQSTISEVIGAYPTLLSLGGITLGTGILAALAINVGSAGAPVIFNGALGTPSSGTLTNCSGLPLTTGITGVLAVANGGTNSSSPSITAFNNITGYTASGNTGTTSTNLVFSGSPTIQTPTILDAVGNVCCTFVQGAATNVNHISIGSQGTGASPYFLAVGSDLNVGIEFATQAAGNFLFRTSATATQFNIQTGASFNQTNFTFAPTTSRTVVFPDASGTITLLGNSSTGTGSVVLADAPSITLPVILDANGNNVLFFNTFTGAVNYFGMQNSPTTVGVSLFSSGTDPNINILVSPKGSAGVGIVTVATSSQLFFQTGPSLIVTEFSFAPSTTRVVTFPDATGTVALQTNSDTSWTPSFTFSTPGNLSLGSVTAVGQYTQIGNMVFFSAFWTGSLTFSTASGSAFITGLPVTVNNTANTGIYCQSTVTGTGVTIPTSTVGTAGLCVPNTKTIELYGEGTGTHANAPYTISNFTTGDTVTINISGFYFV